jgi:hypothetical protein
MDYLMAHTVPVIAVAAIRFGVAILFVLFARLYVVCASNAQISRYIASHRTSPTSQAPSPAALQWGRAVERAASRIPGTHCVPQSIAGLWLLRTLGYSPRICVGVVTADVLANFAAHAWVELGGVPVVSSDIAGRYICMVDASKNG